MLTRRPARTLGSDSNCGSSKDIVEELATIWNAIMRHHLREIRNAKTFQKGKLRPYDYSPWFTSSGSIWCLEFKDTAEAPTDPTAGLANIVSRGLHIVDHDLRLRISIQFVVRSAEYRTAISGQKSVVPGTEA